MKDRMGDWISTYTGRTFWPLEPRAEDVCLEDIAHALSLKGRWGCHARTLCCVGMHSLRVGAVARFLAQKAGVTLRFLDEVELLGDLHDGHEAYLTDVPRPVKPFVFVAEDNGSDLVGMVAWRDLEAKTDREIFTAFGLAPTLEQIELVKQADHLLLAIEAHELLDESVRARWERYPLKPDLDVVHVSLLDWDRAESMHAATSAYWEQQFLNSVARLMKALEVNRGA